tara:strand:- start:1833 stop:2765 length:933 start_codon:yes stop_codon:yes gene_type:complete
MTHGSLFSGIGGFDLAAEWSGFTNLFNCEWEEFPRKVLKHHFPNAEQYGDIKQFNATAYSGRLDILSGGFPCQPFSVAGKRKGSEDERHLWPEMLRVIGECQPRWVVGENVRGLVNWSDGLVFETCCSDLEAIGYSVQSFIIPACATGAPHRRDRVWIVAHSDYEREERTSRRDESKSRSEGIQERDEVQQPDVTDTLRKDAPDTDSERLQRESKNRELERERFSVNDARSHKSNWENFPTVAPICGRDDGLPKELDGITFPKWRRESIKAYGNAIVPQVAYRIFESIQDYEKRKKSPPPCEELSSHHGE